MRGKGFNWPTGLFVIAYHTALCVMLPLYLYFYSPSWQMITISIILYFLTGLSITAGYHRLFSHNAYKAHPIVEGIIVFFGSMATQGSVLRWAFEHRIHHAFVDTDKDPYSIKKGFLYAHMLWLFQKPEPIDTKVVSDLVKKPLLVLQHEYYTLSMIASNVLMFFFVGWLLNDYVGAFVLSWWTRLFFLHHSTWFINSLAHTWGSRSFSQEQSAVDNYVISLLTFGEGYHNYHHTYAHDYRNGIRWYHFDPTKWLIWTLHFFGLAKGLRSVDKYHLKEQMILYRKNELLQWLQNSLHARKEELAHTVSAMSNDALEKIAQLRHSLDHYRISKKESDVTTLQSIGEEIRSLEKCVNEDYKRFFSLSKAIMKMEPS